MSNNPTTTIKFKGRDVKLTWIKSSESEKFIPFFQAYGIVFNNNGEILMIKEKNKWKIPGGTPEKGESGEETLVRELMEEADVEVEKVILLGGQLVEFPDNPDTVQGDRFYQLRYVCLLKKMQPSTPDPDSGKIYPRKFVPAKDISKYVKWGKAGEIMFSDAYNLFLSQLTK